MTPSLSPVRFFLALLLVGTAIQFQKPVWTDELAHFAIGSFDRFFDALVAALHAIRYGQSHNQTGLHMMVDWAMLQIFGASAFWMRFPSLVSFAWIFLAASLAFRRWALPNHWRIFGFFAIGFNFWLREQAYEARPYLPFAAGMIGTWVFFTARPDERKKGWFRAFGGLSLLLASTVHPYFGPYLAVLCLYLLLTRKGRFAEIFEWKWILVASILYLSIAELTWLSRKMDFKWDPFQWIGRGTDAVKVFFSAHLHSLGRGKSLFLGAVLVSFLISFRSPRFRGFRRAESTQWFGLALLLSLALSFSSYWSGYWILQRQWIASIALASVALPGVAYEMERAMTRKFPKRALLLLVWAGLLVPATNEIQRFVSGARAGWPPSPMSEDPNMLEMMNRNIGEGGPVWPRFRTYYDWPNPEEPLQPKNNGD